MICLLDRTLAALRRLDAGRVGVVAISGGPDSVALTWLLSQFRQRGEIDLLILAHLNHQLRGPESDGDEAFVRELAERWAIPVVSERIDVAAHADGRNLEDT